MLQNLISVGLDDVGSGYNVGLSPSFPSVCFVSGTARLKEMAFDSPDGDRCGFGQQPWVLIPPRFVTKTA